MSATTDQLINHSTHLKDNIAAVQLQSEQLHEVVIAHSEQLQNQAVTVMPESPLIMGLTVLVLAIFVGYYVVWKVTPALHSPLMAITNAISSVIIVGAMFAAGLADVTIGSCLGFIAVTLAAINIFGGFVVTQRMLDMFSKKNK